MSLTSNQEPAASLYSKHKTKIHLSAAVGVLAALLGVAFITLPSRVHATSTAIVSHSDGMIVRGANNGITVEVTDGPADSVTVHVVQGVNTYDFPASNFFADSWSANLDVSAFPDGPISVTGIATIGATQYPSPTITLNVGNNVVSLLFPIPGTGQVVSGDSVELDVFTQGPNPDSVDFVIDGVGSIPGNLQTNEISPGVFQVVGASANFDSTGAPLGDYTIHAVATVGTSTFQSDPVVLSVVAPPPPIPVTIVSPLDNAELTTGAAFFEVDVDGADQIDLAVNGDFRKTIPLNSSGNGKWTAVINFAQYDPTFVPGPNTVTAVATFGRDTHLSSEITINVHSAAPFATVVPRVEITTPADGVVVKGNVPFHINTTPSVKSVTFQVYSAANGGVPREVNAKSADGQSWDATWDSTEFPNQKYSLVGMASNGSNSFYSQVVNISTNNPPKPIVLPSATSTEPTATSTTKIPTSTQQTPPLATLDFDPTATGTYSAAVALAANPSIDVDLGIPTLAGPALCTAGSLIKLHDDGNPNTDADTAVYYCGADSRRYVFTNDKVFFSWYSDFSSVQTISADVMANIPLGGDITYRPGSRMVKVTTDPKVYAVSHGSLLRWVATEAAAIRLYGADWNTKIDDISDAFFVNYTFGPAITK